MGGEGHGRRMGGEGRGRKAQAKDGEERREQKKAACRATVAKTVWKKGFKKSGAALRCGGFVHESGQFDVERGDAA